VAAGHAFPYFGMLHDIVHFAFRACFFAHRKMIGAKREAASFWVKQDRG